MEADPLQRIFQASDRNADGGLDEVRRRGDSGGQLRSSGGGPADAHGRLKAAPLDVERRRTGSRCLTAAAARPPPLSPPHRSHPPPQSEVAWLIKAVNPDVPLGEAALGLILEEVRRLLGGPARRPAGAAVKAQPAKPQICRLRRTRTEHGHAPHRPKCTPASSCGPHRLPLPTLPLPAGVGGLPGAHQAAGPHLRGAAAAVCRGK